MEQFKSEDDLIDLERRILVSRVFSRGLTPTQYLEKKARLFIHGRARAYGLRHWGSRRQRQAQLSCFDHGTWAAPLSTALCDGLWDVQLPPD